jgi:hypothetical protein
MFPIVQNVNNLANSLNILRAEVRSLRDAQAVQASQNMTSSHSSASSQVAAATIPIIQQQLSNLDDAMKRVSAQTVQIMQNVTDMKRQVEIIKTDISREIGMAEAMILRKCEVTMHKMISDKIAVALEAQRTGLKDRVAFEARTAADDIRTELAQMRADMDAAIAEAAEAAAVRFHASPQVVEVEVEEFIESVPEPEPVPVPKPEPVPEVTKPAPDDDYAITIEKKAQSPPPPAPVATPKSTPPAPTRRGGKKSRS